MDHQFKKRCLPSAASGSATPAAPPQSPSRTLYTSRYETLFFCVVKMSPITGWHLFAILEWGRDVEEEDKQAMGNKKSAVLRRAEEWNAV